MVIADRRSGVDVTRWDDVQRLEKVEAVCHLAGLGGNEIGREEAQTVNWLGTLNLLEYCRTKGVGMLVFASSYVYGPPRFLPVDEKHPLLGRGHYTQSKIQAEELCRRYALAHGLKAIMLRVFNAYGPGQRGRMLIPSILSQVVSQGEVVLRDPRPRRDFVYVDDVVQAFVLASRCAHSGFRAYNVASGKSISVEEVVRIVEDVWRRPLRVKYIGQERENEVMDSKGSNILIGEELGWEPTVPFREGIRRTLEWWDAHDTRREN